ncbi:pro-FMRFamide-related neuropeptide VF [Trachinotus anak]|uniref:pro-FMRFamide-related neuropeptide VF n=1 Tax=Trachinotus anak TaxID=443729 RepID=UPI0039F250B9
MSTTVFLLVFLMLGGHGGAAASDLHVYGKLMHSDKTLLNSENGGHAVRKQPHQQTNNEIRRSLDLESFNVHVRPTTSKISLPTMIKLYPPTAKPVHMHANMPMRFGRQSELGDDRAPNSNPNMPQRFGRAWEVIRMCAECPDVQEDSNPALPKRLGRNSLFWSLLRSLATEQLLNTGLHWAQDFDFTTSSEEVEMEGKTFKG